MPPSITESTPLVPIQQKLVQQEEEKMSLKFSSVAAAFQLLLIILFGAITRYGDQALPPHLRKNAVGGLDNVSADAHPGNNDISIYYSSKSIYVPFYFASFCFFCSFSLKLVRENFLTLRSNAASKSIVKFKSAVN